MYQEILNQVITTGLGLGILAGAYLLDLLIGSVKVWFTSGMKWSWKKAGEDFIKALVLALGIEAWVVLWNLTSYYCGKCGVDIKAVADGVSNAGMIAAILGATCWYLKNAYDNAVAFIATKHIKIDVGEIKYDEIAGKFYELFETPKEAVEAQKEFEEKVKNEDPKEGGLGVYYSVPIDSYDSFRNAVMGHGYDCDGCYSYQCWDGACLLWMQLGRWLSTGGTGAARGCWEPARCENAGGDFELITNKNDIRRGDIVVFSCGTYGHIGYADANYDGGAYVRLLGQNQSSDMKFCVINMSMATFMGAFRYKGWKQTPTPAPAPTPKKSNEEIAKEVIRGDWGNGADRKARLEAAGYDYDTIQGIVNQMLGGGGTPAPAPAPATGFKVGDRVVPTKLVDYNGTKLTQYDDSYEIIELNGDRAVLGARGAVWAAMNTANIRKA